MHTAGVPKFKAEKNLNLAVEVKLESQKSRLRRHVSETLTSRGMDGSWPKNLQGGKSIWTLNPKHLHSLARMQY